MAEIKKGKITGFSGSFGSGIGYLGVDDEKDGHVEVPCDNGPTVRSLQAAFGNAIGPGHTVNSEGGHVGQTIYYVMDDMDLCLGGFVPEDDATEALVEAYESQE